MSLADIFPRFRVLEVALIMRVFVLQVDLGLLRFVTAVGTQGAISKETKKRYFVKTYRIDISSNGEDWITLKEANKPLVSAAAPFHLTMILCAHTRVLIWPDLLCELIGRGNCN